MTTLILDRGVEAALRAERKASELDKRDEVWDGVYVIMPLANVEHQQISFKLAMALDAVVGNFGMVFNGVNLSDRVTDWVKNYREPDVAVFLEGNAARNCGVHYAGGPDFLAEILSPNDPARDKLPFYAKIGVREVLIVDREPWGLELYQSQEGVFSLVGRSTLEVPDWLTSAVLPARFRIIAGKIRPRIEVEHNESGQCWEA